MLITAKQPSEITLPAHNQGWPTVLAFLCAHFPRIPAERWQQRIRDGKVYWYQGGRLASRRRFCPVAGSVIFVKSRPSRKSTVFAPDRKESEQEEAVGVIVVGSITVLRIAEWWID